MSNFDTTTRLLMDNKRAEGNVFQSFLVTQYLRKNGGGENRSYSCGVLLNYY